LSEKIFDQNKDEYVKSTPAPQESVYLDEEDRKAEGYAGMVSANMNGMQSIKPVVSTFLHHPVFGTCTLGSPCRPHFCWHYFVT
jgi:hypothetical protein